MSQTRVSRRGDSLASTPARPSPRRAGHPSSADRNAEILELRRSGLKLAEIGARFGITRERVRQLTKAVSAEEARRATFRRPRCQTCKMEFGEPIAPGTQRPKYCSSTCRGKALAGKRVKHHRLGADIIAARLEGTSWADLSRALNMQNVQMSVLVWRELYAMGRQDEEWLTHRIWPGDRGAPPGGWGYRRQFLRDHKWAQGL